MTNYNLLQYYAISSAGSEDKVFGCIDKDNKESHNYMYTSEEYAGNYEDPMSLTLS